MLPGAKRTVIALVGPTASGKTALAIALARKLQGEVIACDSRTVYRQFDIGTAKPSAAERAAVPHHLIDIADPEEDFTVANFSDLATKAIEDISARGHLPIVAGGTGFYARALLEGLSIPSVPPQPALRAQLKDFADRQGNLALHEKLQAVDTATAARLGVNDRFRIIRALEVFHVLGQPMSQAATRSEPPYKTIWLGLTAGERKFLHEQIRRRMVQQLEEGIIEETRRLYDRFGPHQKLMHTVNYREFVDFLEGRLSQEEAYQQAIHHNIRLARRQLIWFRANPQIHWLCIDESAKAELIQAALVHIKDLLPMR